MSAYAAILTGGPKIYVSWSKFFSTKNGHWMMFLFPTSLKHFFRDEKCCQILFFVKIEKYFIV